MYNSLDIRTIILIWSFLWLIVYIDITKQLKYSIEGVSKISVSLKQTFFPRLYLGK